ncbi:MAG: hypothetical protein E7655_03440 [Ruminococcaceae bacterium]|nr:hypothetical protein [Oscillospiraceae bacterium]
MKKILLVLFAMLLAFSFTACDSNVDQPDVTDTTDAGEQTEDTTEEAKETEPAAPKMSEEEARQAIYDKMVALANMEWTPKVDFDLSTSSKYLQNITYKVGTTYRGAPYTNEIDATMESFAAILDNGVYMGGLTREDAVGFDCSSAVADAWRAYNPDIRCTTTKTMFPRQGYGCEAVGFYDHSVRGTTILTTEITKVSTEQTMYEAYALLKKSDAVMCRWASEAAHVRLVSCEPVVVRNPDGTIDGKQSYITYCDQTSTIRDFKGYKSNWQIDAKAYFNKLFENWYIPICLEDFYVNRTQEMLFTINGMNDPNNFPARLTGQITCSQKIMEGKVAVLDANGNEMYSEVKELKNYCMQIGSFSLVNLRSAVGKNTGKMTFVVSVKTPSTKDAFHEVTRFDFTK